MWVLPLPPGPGTDPEVGGCEAVRGRHVGGGGGMRIVGIDVGEQGAHDSRHPGTHVLGGEAGKVAGGREWEALGLVFSQDRLGPTSKTASRVTPPSLPPTQPFPFPLPDCPLSFSISSLSCPMSVSSSSSHPCHCSPQHWPFPNLQGDYITPTTPTSSPLLFL